MMLPPLPGWSTEAAYAAVLLPVAWMIWLGARKLRSGVGHGTPAVRVAALAAIGCTAYSADTSWRFAAHHLDMSSTAERAAMFGAAELALFANSLLARQNLNGPKGAPGAPGVIIWVLTGVQIIPAYSESGLVGGTVRAFVGPVMAAMLWHFAMGIELRHRKPDAESRGLTAMLGRELRERVLSRLGIAERDRSAGQITRDRATVRAAALAAGLAARTPKQRGKWRGRRAVRRLAVAVASASVGTDREQRRELLEQLAARRHALSLATIELPSPWDEFTADPAASALAAQTRDQMREATERIRRRGHPALLFADVIPDQTVNAEDRSPEHPAPHPQHGEPEPDNDAAEKLTTAEAQAAIEEGWVKGLSVRETAKRATRAHSYVHAVFVKLDKERGSRPGRDQLALVNGHVETDPETPVETAESPGA